MAKLSVEQLDQIREIVYSDIPEGFIWCYYFIAYENPRTGEAYPLPKHCIKLIVKFYEAKKKGMHFAIEAFRESLKTTVFSILMPVYQIGLHPELETIIVQASDGMAKQNTGEIAKIIKSNKGFRALFPNVRPDPKKWGAEGYDVVNADLDYSDFLRRGSKTPSIMGVGYKGANVQGHHPRMFGILDDINNSRNSRLPREMMAVNAAVQNEIQPAFKSAMNIDVFTPWRDGDVGDINSQRENTLHVRVPIFKLDENGQLTDEPVWDDVWDPVAKKALNNGWPIERIELERANMLPHVWARMYLLDRKGAQGNVLKESYIHYENAEDIPANIPVYITIDYASVAKDQILKGRDYFALSVVGHHPNDYLILLDGVRKHVDYAEAQQIALSYGEDYQKQGRLIRMGIEKQGKGEDFGNEIMRLASWRVKLLTPSNKSKNFRIENELATLMFNRRLRITSEKNNYVGHYIDEYLSWDGLGTYPNDCLDSVYYSCLLAKGFIKWADDTGLYGSPIKRIVQKNPLHRFARRSRNARKQTA
ncbi:hypothetical protein LCGC14_0572730 [marine sediment metagenome]|uniref:Terminase large subunit gp17-like C-terminal domain-containing protein n=1 Tax=marine sediment metagenome TaxID=412755 RepID=A0A0F9S2A7_9ZZZZ